MTWFGRLVMMGFQLDIHQAFYFNRIQIPADHHPQVVAGKFHHMMIVHKVRIFAENRAGFGIFDIALDGHQTFLAHFAKNLEKHGQGIDIECLVVF